MDYYLTQTDNMSATGYGVGTQMSLNAINHSITRARKPTASSLLDKTAQLGFGIVMGYSFDSTYDLLLLTKPMLLLFSLRTSAGMQHGQ